MKAVVYPDAGLVELVDLTDPEPGPQEALVAVRASGICHTDFDVLHARYGPGAFPVGHEYAGDVISVGQEVRNVMVGDRVVVDPNFGCGRCRACGQGRPNLCDRLGAYGVTRNGGFSEFSVVGAGNLVKIGSMPYEIAALAEPMGCVLNGIAALNPKGHEVALVFGAGPIGLLIGMALKARGVQNITFVDVADVRLELAESFGFSAMPSARIKLASMRHSFDLTADATGNAAVAAGLLDFTASGGKCLFFGVCPPDTWIEISPFEVFRRQLTLAGTHSLNHNIPQALEALSITGPDIARLISHHLTLDEVAETLRGSRRLKSMKIQFVAG